MLKIEGLAVEVEGRPILRGVDLHVGVGETHVLLGPNGSGKTTLLGAIIGAARYWVAAGRIVFNGEDVTALSLPERARRGIGLAFQRPPVVGGSRFANWLSCACAMGVEAPLAPTTSPACWR